MFIVNGIAYAGAPDKDLTVTGFRILDRLYMLVTFSNGECRVFDMEPLTNLPAYAPLADDDIFKTARIDHGILTWLDDEIDIAAEAVYARSYPYNSSHIA